jgi:hypothetical protein
MAELNGTLYGAAEGTNSNGALTTVGATGISIDDFGSSSTGLYAVDSSGTLYSIDAATGAATPIGSGGIPVAGFSALSTNASSADGNELYTLDTTTGTAAPIGAFGMSSGTTIQLGALLEENGTLYGGSWAPDRFVATVDTTSGVATIGSALTGTSSSGAKFVALAPYPVAVPAPLIGHGLPVALAVGGVLFGGRLLARSRRRRWFGIAIPHAAA